MSVPSKRLDYTGGVWDIPVLVVVFLSILQRQTRRTPSPSTKTKFQTVSDLVTGFSASEFMGEQWWLVESYRTSATTDTDCRSTDNVTVN